MSFGACTLEGFSCATRYGDDVQNGAAALELFHHMMRGEAAVCRVRVGEHHDDGAIEMAEFLCCIKHRFNDAAAVGRLGAHAKLHHGIAEPLHVGRVVDEPDRLPYDVFDTELRAAEQLIDEICDGHAKNAGTAVVDEDRDVERSGGGLHLDDLSDIAALAEDEIGGREIPDRHFFSIDGGDVHRPHKRNGEADPLREWLSRQPDEAATQRPNEHKNFTGE